jgi:glyoxylase-like metal-dependent hydrolase (beta-lactamase superfamily II)
VSSESPTPTAQAERTSSRNAWAEPGPEQVAAGVHRIPLPLPDELAAVNVYAIERPDGLTLVDAGQALQRSRVLLEKSLTGLGFSLADVREFLVTHAHRDHYTLATQVRRDHGTRVRLGIREAPSMAAMNQPGWPAYSSQLAELRRCGADSLAAEVMADAAAQGMDASLWDPPDSWIVDDELIEVGARRLSAISTPGHTQGHLVFHDAAADLLFAGDHVLPHITPSIGLEPVAGRSPLADFLGSLRKVRRLPDCLLLPAHGPVTSSSHARVDELLLHHDDRLLNTLGAVRSGCTTGLDVARRLAWTRRLLAYDTLPMFHRMLAVVETSAHLRLLVEQRLVEESVDSGVSRFSAATVGERP